MTCDASLGEKCGLGSAFPLASAGHFAELITPTATQITLCIPRRACMGTCNVSVLANLPEDDGFADEDATDLFSSCPGGLGQDSCSTGYMGRRCSLCQPYNPAIDCADDDSIINGYYRLESRCEPCPCALLSFRWMVGLAFLFAVLVLLALDMLG